MLVNLRKKVCYVLLLCMTMMMSLTTFADETSTENIEDKNVIFDERQAPNIDINLAVGETNMALGSFKKDIMEELENRNIDPSNINLITSEQTTVSTNMNDAAEIFNTWGRIGYPGNWQFDNANKIIINYENTDNFTGFYYPRSFEYRNIDFSYQNNSPDSDDDVMGAIIKFNKAADGTVTTYVFALKNSIGHGWPSQVRGGLYKITKSPFSYDRIQPLQEINVTWPRNVWTTYRLVAEDNNIKVYMDTSSDLSDLTNRTPIINYTDNNNPIITGSYGFFSCSQPRAMYRNVKIVSENTKPFIDVLKETTWREGASRFVINLNEGEEEAFATEESLQGVLAKCKEANVHYIGWGSSTNTSISNTFIEENNEEGTFVSTENYKASIKKIVDFIVFHTIYQNGAGTVKHPFIIENGEQLLTMKYNLSGYYELGADVDLEGHIWNPVGSIEGSSSAFTGHFDGKGKTISNFTIDSSEDDYIGFFGVTHNAHIENVTIDHVNIHGHNYVGALIGYAMGEDQIITNCYVGEGIIKGNNHVGGLIGKMEYGGIETCESLVGVEGNTYIGGLIGYGYGMIIKDCRSLATVTGNEDVGGLIGFSNGNIIETCEGIATVVGHKNVGGLAGHSSGLTLADIQFTPMIDTCNSLGNIKGSICTGGLVGYDSYDRIEGCTTSDNVEGDENVGGLIGYSQASSINECSSDALVEGNTNIGDLVGYEE